MSCRVKEAYLLRQTSPGLALRSRTTTEERPARWSAAAVETPAAPPPMTTASRRRSTVAVAAVVVAPFVAAAVVVVEVGVEFSERRLFCCLANCSAEGRCGLSTEILSSFVARRNLSTTASSRSRSSPRSIWAWKRRV